MGSWDDGSRGYGQDEEYATASGYRGYPQDDSYAGYGTYGQGNGYGQPAEYGQQAGYHDGGNGYHDGYSGGGYDAVPGYAQLDDYGYPRGDGHTAADRYAAGSGYAAGNDYPPADQYPRGDGYPPGAGYGQSQGYGGNGQAFGYPVNGYAGSGDYPAQPDGRALSGGYPALPAAPGYSGDYPAHSGDYPAHSGDYPAQGNGAAGRTDVPGRYAGSDWYGGQPAAASGSGFADTGTYAMDARVIDSYGTGPRAAEYGTGQIDSYGTGPRAAEYGTGQYDHDGHQANGYEPDGHHDGYQGGTPGQLAIRSLPPVAAQPTPPEAAIPPGLVHTGQQERYDEYESYPGYGDQGNFDDRRGYDARYADEAPRDYDDYDERAGFGASGYGPAAATGILDGYDDYADDGDPYGDRYGDDGTAPRPASTAGTKGAAGAKGKAGKGRGRRPLLLAALAVVAVGVLGAAAYVFVLKPKPSASSSPGTPGPLPTAGSTSAATADCVKKFGEYCHIELRTDDPQPLTLDELFPPQFLNETDHASFTRAVTRLDTKCADAVIGQDLIKALQSGKCTQVLRASYVSGDNKIMGTIGVVNLATTNEAHYAGRVVGANDFITPLSTSKGITSKLGKGTGVVQAEFKGHYLILTWAEFTSTNAPKTKAEDQQLEQFENDLVAGTANIPLSQRMINGKPSTPGAAG